MSRANRRSVVLLLAMVGVSTCVFVAPASGEVYYVDQGHAGAHDTNPGTPSEPWLTIQHAADTLLAGDKVYVKAGTYGEQVIPANSGTSGLYITYEAFPGDTVVIDGSGVTLPQYEGLFQIESLSYIEVVGFRLESARGHGTSTGIQIEGSSYVTVKDNVTYDTNSSGIQAWGSDHVTIDGNEIILACNAGATSENECLTVGETHDFVVSNNYVHDGSLVRGEGIDTKDGSYNGQVFGNHVHDVMSVGIYIDAWDKYTHDIDLYGNRVHDVAGDGFYVGSEQGGVLENIRIFNNIVYRNKWVGVTVHDCCIPSHPVNNIEIINNTFYDNGWAGGWGGGILNDNDQATNVVFRNNVASQNLSFQIAEATEAVTTIDHNLIDGFRDGEGETRGTDYQEGDPDFVDPSAGDFHVRGGSIAIDSGSSVAAPPVDFDGSSRPQGAGWDIGAFEVGGAIFEDGFESGDDSGWDSSQP